MSTRDDEGRVRPFADVLMEMSRGSSHRELSLALRNLVEAVEETGKKGSVTYRLTVTRMKDGRTLAVSDEIAVKLPEHDRPGSIFWADDEHNLTRNDPTQQPLFTHIREVPAGVDPETGEITEEHA